MNKKNYSEIADQLIKSHTLYSLSSGIIPVPGVDILANTAIQVALTQKLCRLYHIKFEDGQLRSLLNALAGSTFARVSATGTRSLLKLIPGIGTLAGGLALGFYAALSTYASGVVFKMHIENGGTLADFDTEAKRKIYEEKMKEGMEKIEKWKK